MDRQPVVAGRFYDADPARLGAVVQGLLSPQSFPEKHAPEGARTLLAMVPHAGYIYSGGVCGMTLAGAALASTVLLLGPNHTGLGLPFALWPDGNWHIPGAALPVDQELASLLLAADQRIKADTAAHLREHSIEVVLPFLHRLDPLVTMVPLAVASRSFADLEGVGRAIGRTLAAYSRPVSMVVSSDMSHYVSHDEARRLDSLALDAVLALDPRGLFDTVRSHSISMCGVLPMTVALFAALEMGATWGHLAAYATSGEASGDFDQVVGYAGVLVG
ncbi:AmmeMemoRadiSam system protein B [Pseudodesulfovibrio sp. F-1]|uniref:MEMO1 family protein GKC30_00280 n=1 Tax=Pseudodesulfovibrio alkaliphilus TaxID=2661613 RepID=A0A7K1KJ36_9BACT|nr:AmmeMemoRadiSam system protein B [Pseudodesulfovibrio alkaliphilus]MUM76066.1 AmmeMemoRadiSam system protein B [Pseudodesulfovibrio alkaliphilus]